ncbi:MAG: sulfurtransferase, partial [Planctomycetes bacterium]|nr:sulfurtransferase [Planctomycetota bacterium]
ATLTRAFLLGDPAPRAATWATDPPALTSPTMVSAAWLQQHLGTTAVLDVRAKASLGELRLPGAVHLAIESLRVKTGDRDLHFVGDDQLAARFGALGIGIDTPVVIYSDVKVQDATLTALALLRLGHRAVAILEGGILRWATERRPLVATRVTPAPVVYQPRPGADDFSITTDQLAAMVAARSADVLDVRPADFFRGDKSTEARPGHIPGAKNRLYSQDLVTGPDGQWLRPRADVQREYDALGLATDKPVVVSCRTGHTASYTYFVLRHLLGRDDVRWYNGSWTEWAGRSELPAETGGK